MPSVASDALVAVIGSGVMGAGIAQVAAAAGHPVALYDINAAAVSNAVESVRASFRKLAAKGRMREDAATAAGSRVGAASTIRELSGAKLVVEAIYENLEAKRKTVAELELIVQEDCILASNTSSLSITAIAAGLKRPERVVGMHFFNPAPVMELVEVVRGLETGDEYAATVFETAAAWGKTPVYARSTPGFIVNRVARPYYGEALRLLTERAGTPASIDAVMREAGGFRMGPFELMDLIGQDVNFAVTRSVFNAYFNEPRFTPSLAQQELVEAGFLGRKSGRGFFDYRQGAAKPTPDTEAAMPIPSRCVAFGSDPLIEALAKRVAVAREAAGALGPAIEVDGVFAAITDGRTAAQRAAETSVADFVVVDLALDYEKATRLAIASRGDASSVIGLLQAAGYAVTRLKDVPGLAVMRTVAMLANEAADAVNQGVASVDGVDTAMRKGVNYPLGPLGWANRIGMPRVAAVLSHLAAYYGEDRYRMSPLIRELGWAS